MSRRRIFQTAKVFHVSLDEPLRPLEVDEGYRDVVLILTRHGQAIGRVTAPALRLYSTDILASIITRALGDQLWWRTHVRTVRRAAGLPHQKTMTPTVSAVVCTKDRPDVLARCLESLLELSTPAHEIIVVDNCPSNDATRRLCEKYPVRYVLESAVPGVSRARNRGIMEATGDLVAFTDDDCVVDAHWLDDLGDEFEDSLVMAVAGFVGPAELETRAQYQFELHGGFHRGFERRVFNGAWDDPVTSAGPAGASANAIFRRSIFEEVGLFSEDLGPGTPARSGEDTYTNYRILAAGYRIVWDPKRIVWHRHRSDDAGLRRVLYDYAASSFAYATRCLIRHRELSAFRFCRWWWFHHIPRDLWAIARRRERRIPLRCVLGEIRGTFAGPWRLRRSARSRRAVPALELPPSKTSRPTGALHVADEAPSLSIVIPSHNRADMLGRVLDGLAQQTYPASRSEAVIVLDACTDGSAEMLRSRETPFPLRVLEGTHTGIAAVRNTGVAAATNDVIVFLDDDIVPEPSCLAEHARTHRDRADAHVALGYCPPVVDDGGWWAHVLRSWWEDHFRRKRERNHQWSYFDLTTGNSSLPRSLLLAFGGFDEDFAKRHEDWELGVRMLEHGVKLAYYQHAAARHHLDTRLATTVRNQRQEARDDVLLARKHPHVMGQLPLANYARGRPDASMQFIDRYLPLADRLEAAGMRHSWQRLARRLARDAYVVGLKDAVPSAEDFFALVAPIWTQSLEKVEWILNDPGPAAMPAVGSIELAVEYDGTALGRVVAVDPGDHWEWISVAERVAAETTSAARTAYLRQQLGLAEPDGDTRSELAAVHVR